MGYLMLTVPFLFILLANQCSAYDIGIPGCTSIPLLGYLLPCNYTPNQIHIALGETPADMTIMWSTDDCTGESIVQYKDDVTGNQYNATGCEEILAHLDLPYIVWYGVVCYQYIHTVKLRGLTPRQTYTYRVGSSYGWSPYFKFCTIKNTTDWSPEIYVFGDIGSNKGAATITNSLISQVRNDTCQVFIPNGDMAYDMYLNCGQIGDDFLNQIQPLATQRPLMVTVGNHEWWFNFTDYKSRFNMPFTDDNMFYTYTVGPARIIAANSEVYFEFRVQLGLGSLNQHNCWVEKVLQEANKPENRATHPWIIFLIHRPFYCSTQPTLTAPDCSSNAAYLRKNLEQMLCKYGVDLIFTAHQHNYESFWPVYNNITFNSTSEFPFTNPKVPIQILSGSSGNTEGQTTFTGPPLNCSKERSKDIGFTKLNIYNSSHLQIRQILTNGTVIDNIMLIKDTHVGGDPSVCTNITS